MTTPSTLAYDPLSPAVQRDPYPFYAALRHDARPAREHRLEVR